MLTRRCGRTLLSLLTAAVAWTASPRDARANGRYPYAQQLIVDSRDERSFLLRATYGILTSNDGGETWFWICEAAIGYDPTEDPMMAALASNTVIAGTSRGLFATADRGCSWPLDPTIGAQFVRDVATEDGGSRALALAVTVQSNGSYTTVVYRSDGADAGAPAWSTFGTQVADDLIPTTLDPAPSDDQRIYVAGATQSSGDAGAAGRGVIVRTRDGGASWERREIPGTGASSLPYIAAVSPTNPDVVYVRVQGAFDGVHPVQSWLLYTSDAGDHWKEIFRGNADLLGFALSTGGDTVFAGLGDTHDPNRPVDATALGLYRASTADLRFTRVMEGQVGCLTATARSLYVCGGTASNHFELGVSHDQGESVTPLLRYGGVRGPLACSAETAQASQCAPIWKYNCQPMGSCPVPDGGTSGDTSSSGGCGCGSPGSKSSKPSSGVGTARLDMVPDSLETEAGLLVLAGGIARRLWRKRGRRDRA
jgi:photosystem II stability/assembly factor-like uncharacterized protein